MEAMKEFLLVALAIIVILLVAPIIILFGIKYSDFLIKLFGI
jgi:hypothetical protein